MSKIKEVLEKQTKLLERKAKKAVLATAIAATTVTGFGLTSCGHGENSDNKPKTENVTMTPEQQAKSEQEKAQALLKEIEASGIPTVKKDKEGNVTEILSSIVMEELLVTERMVTTSKNEHGQFLGAKIRDFNLEGAKKFENPKYMKVHQEARVENLGGGVEKHYRAREYETTPANYCIVDTKVRREVMNDVFRKEVDAQGDTLLIPVKNVVGKGTVSVEFRYPEKQNTLTNFNEQMQLAQSQKGRND